MGVFLGGTQSSSDSPGAAITFRFNGTAVWYFSDHQANNTVVSVSVDDDLPDIVNTASTSDVWVSSTSEIRLEAFLMQLFSSRKCSLGARLVWLMVLTP